MSTEVAHHSPHHFLNQEFQLQLADGCGRPACLQPVHCFSGPEQRAKACRKQGAKTKKPQVAPPTRNRNGQPDCNHRAKNEQQVCPCIDVPDCLTDAVEDVNAAAAAAATSLWLFPRRIDPVMSNQQHTVGGWRLLGGGCLQCGCSRALLAASINTLCKGTWPQRSAILHLDKLHGHETHACYTSFMIMLREVYNYLCNIAPLFNNDLIRSAGKLEKREHHTIATYLLARRTRISPSVQNTCMLPSLRGRLVARHSSMPPDLDRSRYLEREP